MNMQMHTAYIVFDQNKPTKMAVLRCLRICSLHIQSHLYFLYNSDASVMDMCRLGVIKKFT